MYERLYFNRLIDLNFSISLDSILFTRIPDLPSFTLFIRDYLESLLNHEAINAKLVVISSPLILIKEYWEELKGEPKNGLYHTGGDLVRDLQSIAKKFDIAIIITAEEILKDKVTKKIHPRIQISAENKLRYKAFGFITTKHFELNINTDQIYYTLSQKSSKTILMPSKGDKSRDHLFARFCNLPPLIELDKVNILKT